MLKLLWVLANTILFHDWILKLSLGKSPPIFEQYQVTLQGQEPRRYIIDWLCIRQEGPEAKEYKSLQRERETQQTAQLPSPVIPPLAWDFYRTCVRKEGQHTSEDEPIRHL
ncbi:unnamed protein product [Pleuronectes platessa]|uniref:Uncharacterized protein n=1 Tax=Pleuronectes platessa TaxID=8262 RepID=A0A9N7YY69_PLEPL|nr:unnamed protein product [Pleuronectes platessa]